jgi:ABC-type lipoprotein release transport system permease subunit
MVAFAVWISLIMRSFQIGSYDHMVSNLVHSWSGYFQIHSKGYQDDQVLNNSFQQNSELDSIIATFDGLDVAPRLESFALSSYGTKTRGAILTGIDPEAENGLTSVYGKMVQGSFITANDNESMVSSRLASYLGLSVGDTLVIIGQGYQGASAAGIFPVKGILKFPSPELDKQMIFLSLPAAQEFFSAPGQLTSMAFNMKDPDELTAVVNKLRKTIDPELYEVLDWKEMMPEMVQQIEGDNISGIIMLGILYVIIGFGILGTVLMITTERIREFGMMMAVGMSKTHIVLMQGLEMIQIGIIGVLTGTAMATPIVYWFHQNPIRLQGDMAKMMEEFGFEPIMPAAFKAGFFTDQAVIILGVMATTIVISSLIIFRLNVIKALRK